MLAPPRRPVVAAPSPVPSFQYAARLGLRVALLAMLATRVFAAGAPDTAQSSTPATSAPAFQRPVNPGEALTAFANNLARDGRTVAVTVGGRAITKADIADVIRTYPPAMTNLRPNDLYRRAMDQLISENLATLSAIKMGLDKDPDVQRRAKTAADGALADAWINREADAAVTEQALRARYDRDIAGKPGPMEVRMHVILLPTEAEATSIIAKIQGGADFDDMARQFSKDTTAAAGGDAGYVTFESIAPEAAIAGFALGPGQMTAYPVHTQAGYLILRVVARRQRATPSFDEVRPLLVGELRREAAAAAVRGLTADMKLIPPADDANPGAGPAGSAR